MYLKLLPASLEELARMVRLAANVVIVLLFQYRYVLTKLAWCYDNGTGS
jgi:hypothetical protein